MNKEDIRVGSKKYSLIKNPIKRFKIFRYKRKHKKLHNNNDLFYPTQPALLEAIVRATDLQLYKLVSGKANLIDKHSYYEFGVFKGFSLWFAYMYAKLCGIKEWEFYGFDSFEGLPKSKIDGIKPAFNKGHYSNSMISVISKFIDLNVDFNRMNLFSGFYSKETFNNHKDDYEMIKTFNSSKDDLKKINTKFLPISICVIDVDIYESTVEVLDFIKDYLVEGSIMLFDDYNLFNNSNEHGERRALKEFKKKYPNFKLKKLFDFGYGGRAFEVIKI